MRQHIGVGHIRCDGTARCQWRKIPPTVFSSLDQYTAATVGFSSVRARLHSRHGNLLIVCHNTSALCPRKAGATPGGIDDEPHSVSPASTGAQMDSASASIRAQGNLFDGGSMGPLPYTAADGTVQIRGTSRAAHFAELAAASESAASH
jgi:hypothetical protein